MQRMPALPQHVPIGREQLAGRGRSPRRQPTAVAARRCKGQPTRPTTAVNTRQEGRKGAPLPSAGPQRRQLETNSDRRGAAQLWRACCRRRHGPGASSGSPPNVWKTLWREAGHRRGIRGHPRVTWDCPENVQSEQVLDLERFRSEAKGTAPPATTSFLTAAQLPGQRRRRWTNPAEQGPQGRRRSTTTPTAAASSNASGFSTSTRARCTRWSFNASSAIRSASVSTRRVWPAAATARAAFTSRS